ncbi:PhzF family phenazine biosynthesis protein [Agaribacterium sp. ZY112]|uniref:PhzF family phenazine biosynthesis protein n=1 Tax=Agaribacterium sp. ZY112 TaxID=3233574 RepID=UPI0035244EC5
MEIDIYQVDAFSDQVFSGNPAAICPLKAWLPDEQMQQIAEANNLSETAFFVTQEDGYALRWFTPESEVDLCGHATLASAHVLYKHLAYTGKHIRFYTKSGVLVVEQCGQAYSMNFPSVLLEKIETSETLFDALSIKPKAVFRAYDYIVVLQKEEQVRSLKPDFSKLCELDLRGVVVTAPGSDVDFVCRCFYPKLSISEDPVTGSAFCELAPYWARVLDKNTLTAAQLSKRGGYLECEVLDGCVVLKGKAADYMQGKIRI